MMTWMCLLIFNAEFFKSGVSFDLHHNCTVLISILALFPPPNNFVTEFTVWVEVLSLVSLSGILAEMWLDIGGEVYTVGNDKI